MKILIDARLYGLENAGLGRYLINLVRELSSLDKENKYTILLRRKYFNQLKLPGNFGKILADFRHYTLLEQIRLPQILARDNPDIAHFPHFNVPIFYHKAFVVTIHDILMHKQKGKEATTLPLPMYRLKRLFYYLVFRKAVLGSSKIIVPSKSVKKELADYYRLPEDKLVVTYEGLDERVIPKGNGAEVLKKYKIKFPYFIYVGNAYPHKNLSRAIEATVFLNKAKKEKVFFAIATARDVFFKRLERYVAQTSAQKYVKLLGFVPDEDLGVLLKKSVGFLYPSLSEGFGLQGLEAIAAGSVVLASDIPVFREVYKDNVFYFNPYDFSSIEKAMHEAINMDKNERKEFIEKSQKFIKRYTWRKMAKQTLKVYESSTSIRPRK